MTTPQATADQQDANAIRETLLFRFRIARAELAVVQNELDMIGGALRHKLITPHQAMQMAFDCDAMCWLFQEQEATT